MKQIIQGRKYNTETAAELGSYSNNYDVRDFSHYEETLYRKKTGEYFLYGIGGPASKYSRSCGQNQWEGSCKILPMSDTEAKEWAEKHLEADEFEVIFGEVEE